jgi:hypothetical protein
MICYTVARIRIAQTTKRKGVIAMLSCLMLVMPTITHNAMKDVSPLGATVLVLCSLAQLWLVVTLIRMSFFGQKES